MSLCLKQVKISATTHFAFFAVCCCENYQIPGDALGMSKLLFMSLGTFLMRTALMNMTPMLK